MSKDVDILFGHELEIAVMEEIFKKPVPGKLPVFAAEGEYSISSRRYHEGEMDDKGDENRGVFLYNADDCAKYHDIKDPKDWYKGHELYCYEVVPDYASSIHDAMRAVFKVQPKAFNLTFIDDLWIAEVYDLRYRYEARIPGKIGEVDNFNEGGAATVICKALLKMARKQPTPDKPSGLKKLLGRLVCFATKHDLHGFGGHFGWDCRRCGHHE